MKNTGWICPKCGRVYAPFILECAKCNNTTLETSVCPEITTVGIKLDKEPMLLSQIICDSKGCREEEFGIEDKNF